MSEEEVPTRNPMTKFLRWLVKRPKWQQVIVIVMEYVSLWCLSSFILFPLLLPQHVQWPLSGVLAAAILAIAALSVVFPRKRTDWWNTKIRNEDKL